MEKIYLIIYSGAHECEVWMQVFAFKNKHNAVIKFNELVKEEITHAEQMGWKTESRDNYFSAYESGRYIENHVDVTLQETELL